MEFKNIVVARRAFVMSEYALPYAVWLDEGDIADNLDVDEENSPYSISSDNFEHLKSLFYTVGELWPDRDVYEPPKRREYVDSGDPESYVMGAIASGYGDLVGY